MPTKPVPHGTVTVTEDPPVVPATVPAVLTIRDVASAPLSVLTPAQEAILARWVTYVMPDGPHTGEHRPALVITKTSDDRCTLSVFTDPTDAPYQGHPYQLGVTSKFRVAYDETGETLNTWH